jgi:hypothetical protein
VAAIGPRAVLTQRARAEACRRVGKDAHAVAAAARDYHEVTPHIWSCRTSALDKVNREEQDICPLGERSMEPPGAAAGGESGCVERLSSLRWPWPWG